MESLGMHLSKALRKELGTRAVQARKGDRVKVMRGSSRNKEGKITAVDYKKERVFVENIVRKKASGAEIPVAIHNSNLMLVELERKDDLRLKRVKGIEKKAGKKETVKEEKIEKPEKKEEKKQSETTEKKEEKIGKKAAEKESAKTEKEKKLGKKTVGKKPAMKAAKKVE